MKTQRCRLRLLGDASMRVPLTPFVCQHSVAGRDAQAGEMQDARSVLGASRSWPHRARAAYILWWHAAQQTRGAPSVIAASVRLCIEHGLRQSSEHHEASAAKPS